MVLLPSLILFVASATAQQPLDSASIAPTTLDIQKVSRVMREDDPTGRNHSTKVVIAPHPPLQNVVEWKLILNTHDEETVTLNLTADGGQPNTQTEFIFPGNLPESKSIFLQAKDGTNVVAMEYLGLPVVDLKSRVAWVGDVKTSEYSSLRVEVGSRLGHVSVNGVNCTSSESPCYFISPDPKPDFVERCLEVPLGSGKTPMLCDEREALFQEMLPRPTLYHREEEAGALEVSYGPSLAYDYHLEVVAYDLKDHGRVYSNASYKCHTQNHDREDSKDGKTCLHDLSFPKEKNEMMVLVVQIDHDGFVTASDLQIFRGNPPNTNTATANVMVTTFVYVMISLAVLILIGMFIVRRRQTIVRKRREADESSKVNQENGESTQPCIAPSHVTSQS